MSFVSEKSETCFGMKFRLFNAGTRSPISVILREVNVMARSLPRIQ
jgi:hypothetical protein